MLKLNLSELWITSEQKLKDFKAYTHDEILKDKIDSIINHLNGTISSSPETVIPSISRIENVIGSNYYRHARFRTDEIEKYEAFKAELRLLKQTINSNLRSIKEANAKKETPQVRFENKSSDYYKEMWPTGKK